MQYILDRGAFDDLASFPDKPLACIEDVLKCGHLGVEVG